MDVCEYYKPNKRDSGWLSGLIRGHVRCLDCVRVALVGVKCIPEQACSEKLHKQQVWTILRFVGCSQEVCRNSKRCRSF